MASLSPPIITDAALNQAISRLSTRDLVELAKELHVIQAMVAARIAHSIGEVELTVRIAERLGYDLDPDDPDDPLWRELGEVRAQARKTMAALDDKLIEDQLRDLVSDLEREGYTFTADESFDA